MINRSGRPRPIAGIRYRLLRAGALGAFLAGTLAVGFGTPITALAATSTSVGSSNEARAFQHSAQDKVAYLHDGSLLVGYYDPTGPGNGIIKHVTNPATAPVSTQVDTGNITGGSEVTFYTLPSTNSTEIWIGIGSELPGGQKQEQVQYGNYNGSTFTWGAVTTVPGSLTSGRQDPSITWTGKWLIASWWDDTLGGGTDTVFYNWTTTKQGTGGWHVPAKSGTTLAASTAKAGTSSPATLVGATSINYNPVTGAAPATNDVLDFGAGTANSDVRAINASVQESGSTAAATLVGATSINYTAISGVPVVGDVFTFGSGGTADVRTVTGVGGTAPNYTLTVAALTFAHAMSELDTGPYTLTVSAFTHPHALGETVTVGAAAAGATTINYTGTAPAAGDNFQIGTAISNNGLTTCGTSLTAACDADFVQVTGYSAGVITFTPALNNGHAVGEPVRIAAQLLTPVAPNSVQVAIRHSAKLGATIAVYGAGCQILTRTLLDGAADPSPANWTTESAVDTNDDCENNFGGPQIAIDESTGNIHVFKAVTNAQGATSWGITYWLGTPDGTPMVSGLISWNSRLVIDPTSAPGGPSYCLSLCNPPDVAGAVDSTGRVYIYWATATNGGAIKFVTLDSPYTTPSAIGTVATMGSGPRYPHVPAQTPLTRGYVPLFYESGTGPYNIMLTTLDTMPPTVPAGLTGTATTKPSVVLNWTASTDTIDGVSGYTVYRGGVQLATVSGATTTTYTDNSVSGNTPYTYTVDAFDPAGNHSAQSLPFNTTTPDATPPTVPAGLSATPTKAPEVDLSWNASTDTVDGVSGYTIYRGGTMLTTVSGTTLTYADKAVVQTTTYSYSVDAFDAAGNHSAQSSPVSATTPDITPPSVPTGLIATATAGPSVTLNWAASTDNVGVTGYTIYRGGVLLTTSTATTYVDHAVVSGGVYTYTVDAFDAAGNHSAQSAPATVNSPDTIPPTVPTGLAGSVTAKFQGTLTWNASTDDVAVTGYTIYRNGVSLGTVSATTLTYADTTVNDITTYTYAVDAFDAAGNHSAKSPTISVTTPDWTPPTVPTGLTATLVQTPEVDLSWTKSTDNVGVTGYTIYRNGTVLTTVSGTTTSYADKAILVPANYSYTVDAFDAAGNHSAQSTAATIATVDTTPPSVPTGVAASATSTSAHVSWNASTDNVGVTGYTIYRNGTSLTTVSGTTLSYIDTTIGGLATYSYTIDAFDAAGNHSARSAAAVVSTVACAGSTLFATYFTWFDNASPGMLNDNIHLLNTGGTTSTGCVTLGAESFPFSLAAAQETHVSFPAGTIGGPVIVTVNTGPRVLASQRVQYYKSFNETWGMNAAQAATTLYFTWFDKASPGMFNDNIHIVNPGTTMATGSVSIPSIPGSPSISFSVAGGAESYLTFPAGTIGGPVIVTSTQPVLASQRVQYYQTFNEVEAMTASQAAMTSYFSWFDKASPGMFNDNIHIVNPGSTLASGAVSIPSIPGAPSISFSVAAGGETYVTFPAGTIGGPVIVTSSQPVLASQRVQYYQSFNEVASSAPNAAAAASYFMWFDKASPGMVNDNIHIVNPGTSSASVTVTLAGSSSVTVIVGAGAEAFVSVPPGAIGGPVTVSSTQPVLASQRVQYYQSFNEVPASP